MIMTKEEFRRRWNKDDNGDGITNDDCADCYVCWGLGAHPRTRPIAEVVDAVCKAAGVDEPPTRAEVKPVEPKVVTGTVIEIPHGIPNLHTAQDLSDEWDLMDAREDSRLPFDHYFYGSEECWKRAREKKIGASEVSTILGLNTFKTRRQLFEEKVGLRKDTFKGNAQTRLGQSCEPLIRALWALEHPNHEVYDPTYLHLVSRARPWQACSLDMVIYDRMTNEWHIGEIKTGTFDKKWSGAYCPDGYFAQVCYELDVTGFDGAFLLGRVRPRSSMINDFSWEKHYFYTSQNPAVRDETRRIVGEVERFYKDIERGALTPVLNI